MCREPQAGDGVNSTYNDEHMWLSPLTRESGGLTHCQLPSVEEEDTEDTITADAVGHG